MNIRTYIITFFGPSANLAGFTHFLTSRTDLFKGYWNHIPLVYFVKSEYDAGTLADYLQNFFPEGMYVIAEVNPSNLNGRLPKDAWNWFYSPPTSVVSGGISSLLGNSSLQGERSALAAGGMPPPVRKK